MAKMALGGHWHGRSALAQCNGKSIRRRTEAVAADAGPDDARADADAGNRKALSL